MNILITGCSWIQRMKNQKVKCMKIEAIQGQISMKIEAIKGKIWRAEPHVWRAESHVYSV